MTDVAVSHNSVIRSRAYKIRLVLHCKFFLFTITDIIKQYCLSSYLVSQVFT